MAVEGSSPCFQWHASLQGLLLLWCLPRHSVATCRLCTSLRNALMSKENFHCVCGQTPGPRKEKWNFRHIAVFSNKEVGWTWAGTEQYSLLFQLQFCLFVSHRLFQPGVLIFLKYLHFCYFMCIAVDRVSRIVQTYGVSTV